LPISLNLVLAGLRLGLKNHQVDKIIQLNGSDKQGRYVRIQLLDKNYLSLAEVQVIGTDFQVEVCFIRNTNLVVA
jgi:hypothetical protein